MTYTELTKIWNETIEDMKSVFGTRTYTKRLHELVDTLHDFPIKSDLKFSAMVKYIDNYMETWEHQHNEKFNPDNIMKIKIPVWIRNIDKTSC